MFVILCGDKTLDTHPERALALTIARKLSVESSREYVVEGPRTRYIYTHGELDRFWMRTKT